MHGETGREIEGGIFSRHTKSARHGTAEDPLSEEYKTLTRAGVEKARETARVGLLEAVEKAPDGTVLFIGGKSDQQRTGDTGEVYGDELSELARGRDDLAVITKKEIDQRLREGKERGGSKVVEEVVAEIQKNPSKKVVVDYPVLIKQLAYAYDGRWTDDDGNKTEYFDLLVKKYNGSHAEAVHDWIKNQGELTLADGRIIHGPKPEDVAKQYLQGLARLQGFARKMLPNRPIMVHGVGHQWDLDAVATYLAKGKVDYDSFREVTGSSVINESEMMSDVTIAPDGRTHVAYRGQEFEFNPGEEERE